MLVRICNPHFCSPLGCNPHFCSFIGTDYKSAPTFRWYWHGLQIRANIQVVLAWITNPRQHSGGIGTDYKSAPTFPILSLNPCIAFPNAPHLFFIGRLSVVGDNSSGEGPGGPSELDPFFCFPAFENCI
jgi:hypothetical protein